MKPDYPSQASHALALRRRIREGLVATLAARVLQTLAEVRRAA